MNTADNTPLVYDPLEIPDGNPAHPPAPVDSVGINIAAARLVFPLKGLRLLLPPWANMGRGDAFRIKLNDLPMVTGSIDEETEVVERFIPGDRLVDGDFNLNYDVRILGEPGYTSSAVTKIHVKIDFAPPGGPDLDGTTPGHSELKLTTPFLPPDAVDQDAARQGVPVTIEPYPIMAEGDRIRLSWGGEIIWATVEPQHLPPQNAPLVITVDEATILTAGDTDTNGLAVVFEVYDVVDNKSADWSAEVRVIVDTGNSRLLAPLIKESFNLVLDMDQLGEADLTFQVFTLGNDFAVGDEIEMSLSGLTASGERIEKVYPPEVITNASGITEFKRPSAEVRQLAGGLHAAFFYRLIKADGSGDLTSKVFSPRIVGRANPLAAPIPLDEIAGTLDPQLPGTTIEIPLDPAMEEGNAIALIWNGITESGSSYTPDLPLHPLSKNEAEGSVPIEIVVAGEHLTAIEGGTLDLYYKLLRDAVSREVIEEESLHADLLTIGLPQAELPPPVVEGESDGVLDPADKPNGTRLIVRQYSGQEAGDRVHILWWGSNTGRYRDSLPVTEVTENQDIPFTISAALIEGNRNGTVRAMYWVRRVVGGTSPSETLLMSIGAGMDLTAPSVKQATGSSPTQQLNPVGAKDTLTVVIPDYGVQPGDQVSVTWAGTAGAGSHTTPVQALPADREIAIPVEVIAYNLGRSVTVTYTVTRNGNESDPSAALNLAVQTLAENDLSGSKPKILQAANNGEGTELDLNSISADATCRAGIWPLIAPDQDVWLRLKGTRADGTVPYDLNIWAPPPRGPRTSPTWITQGFYDVMAAYSYLKELKDGSTLSMEFKADFSKTTNEANALTFPLRTYTVKTVALVNPTLTDVRDTKGSVVGKTTVETTVTVTGTGSSGQQIQLMNGAANIGSPFTIPATGTIWSTSLTGLTPNAYSIKAKALYGTGIPDSAAKNFNVTAIEIPRITNVETAAGVEVPDGSITDQVNVTLFGKASKNQRVEIFDSAISKGTVDVNGGGDWSLHQNGLEQGLHSFTAKGLYGNNPESAVRSFTVQTSTEAPTITSVQDPANTEIPNGGYTVSTTVNVIGRAQRSERLQIFDNAVYRGDVEVDGNGNWSLLMGALVPGPHLFTAKALYGNNPESNVWGINVYVPLIVDPSDINLSATHYRKDATPPNPPSGAYAHRAVSGGTPPYACTSSNPAAVEAYMYDASTVRVISKGSAGSTITVSDQLGQTTAFNVWASNVQMFLPAFNRGNYRNCRDWINGQGCRVPSEYEWGALWTNYNQNMGLGDWRNWILDPGGAPVGKKYVINPHTLAKFLIMDFGDVPPYASENADGFGVKGV